MKDMSEAKGERPPLTGLDLVLQQALYGLVRYPQADLMSDVLTFRALLSDPDPVGLIRRYLETPLPKKDAEHMLLRARRAHAAYLPEDKIPVIEIEDMERVWETGKSKVEEALLFLMGETENDRAHLLAALGEKELPLSEFRAAAEAAAASLTGPKVSALLEAYRERFRDEHFSIEEKDMRDEGLRAARNEIQKAVFIDMRAVANREDLDTKKLERIFEMFEGIEGA